MENHSTGKGDSMSLGSAKRRRNAPSRDFTALTYVDGLDLPLLEKTLPLGKPALGKL